MKKILSILSLIAFAMFLSFNNSSDLIKDTNLSNLFLMNNANAEGSNYSCTVSVECTSPPGTISCTGKKSCRRGSFTVTCDGNTTQC